MSEKEYMTECVMCCLKKLEWHPTEDWMIQVGCEVGRLEQFVNAGAEIIYDDGPESYKIDRFCNRFTRYADVPVGMDPAEFSRKRSEIKVDVIVYAAAHNEVSDIRETLDSLAMQSPLPHSVKVVPNDPDFDPIQIYASIADMDLPYKWGIWTPMPDRSPLDIVDDVVKKFTGQFYSVFDAGHFVRKDFLNRLEYASNEKLQVFNVVLSYEDGQGTTFNRMIHNIFYGNSEQTLLSKLRNYALQNGEDPRILEFSDLGG